MDTGPDSPRSSPHPEGEITCLEPLLRPRREFLDLPGEIRNLIYGSFFASTRLSFARRYLHKGQWRRIKPAQFFLAIILTCRQVYEETKRLWMSQVTFSFEHPDSMLEKLYFLPSSVLSQICHLRIHYAYLDLDTTSEAHKLLNNRYPKWLE